ncbi:MAG: BlaI/MecI/CopY family transcriptional regulator [Verrucomicrobiales bacterium]|nr:BlaI/MecI/CopY family transcriptional regulator [Verrucomicrobiales bacterium]
MKAPNISEAEWTVMETLWERAPQTASEVAKSLQHSTGWAVNTVRTMLSRLVEKGAVVADESESGVRVFSPVFERDAMVRAESESFLNRVFQGAAQPLLVHFATQSNLSIEEIDQLKQLLDESVKKSPRRRS